jgi:hypothetical protein
MTKDEALKMAIEQLWSCSMLMNLDHSDYLYEDVIAAHDACKEALKQPAQKTVGWNEEEFNEIAYAYRICPAHKVNMVSERYQDLVAYVLSLKDKNT